MISGSKSAGDKTGIIATMLSTHQTFVYNWQYYRILSFNMTFKHLAQNWTFSTQQGIEWITWVDHKSTYGSLDSPTAADLQADCTSRIKTLDINNFGDDLKIYAKAPRQYMEWIDTDASPSTSNAANFWCPAVYWFMMKAANVTTAELSDFVVVTNIQVQLRGLKK